MTRERAGRAESSPRHTGSRLFPSIWCRFGAATPHASRKVGSRSRCAPGVLATAPARAQTAEETGAEATEAFRSGDYERAIQLFEIAFEMDPHPVIMFNLGRACQEVGDLPAALLNYRNIRAMDAPPELRELADAKVLEVENALRAEGYDPDTVSSSTYVPRAPLAITSQPAGAAVYLDGTYAGRTPYRQDLTDEGSYALRLELEGYHPVTQDIEVSGGRNNLRSFNLTPRTTLEEYTPPAPGQLTVRAPVPGLDVSIDGEFFSRTPVLAQGLAPGTYVLTISGAGWAPYTSTIDVIAGEETEVVARMASLDAEELAAPRRGRRLAGVSLMGAGGACFASGTALGILALGSSAQYRDNPSDPDRGSARDSARRNALGADISYGVGGALFIAGAILRWVNTAPSDNIDQDLLVVPTSHPGASLRTTW